MLEFDAWMNYGEEEKKKNGKRIGEKRKKEKKRITFSSTKAIRCRL